MKRQPFYVLMLKGFGYIVLANALCLFVTMALSMFSSMFGDFGADVIFDIIMIICTTLIFYMLIFTVAWKDGCRERSLVKNHRVDAPLKHRWVFLGLLMFAFAALPTFILLLNKLFFPQEDTFLMYRFISGSSYPFILSFVPSPDLATKAWIPTDYRQIDNMSVLFPALMLIYYVFIPLVTQLGWHFGYTDKFNSEKMIYK